MDSFKKILGRDDSSSNDTIINLMIALLSLVFVALVLVGVLVLLRRSRRQQQNRAESLPQYHDGKRHGNRRGLTVQTSNFDEKSGMGRSSVVIYSNGKPMLQNPESPPYSPDNVPEIHLTFPDEEDDQGKRKSGRVVIIRVGEATVGMEPLNNEQLPAYEKDSKSEFYAIDLEKIGGLKEKELNYH